LKAEGLINLFLAADCLIEVDTKVIAPTRSRLLQKLQQEAECPELPLSGEASQALVDRIVQHSPTYLEWLEKQAKESKDTQLRAKALVWFINHHQNALTALPMLKQQLFQEQSNYEESWRVRQTIVSLLFKHYRHLPETLPWLKEQAQRDDCVGMSIAHNIAKYFPDDPATVPTLIALAKSDKSSHVRRAAAWRLGKDFCDASETLPLLKFLSVHDESPYVRRTAIRRVSKAFGEDPEMLELLCEIAKNDPFVREDEREYGPRIAALKSLLEVYPTHPKPIELLRDRAINDPDEQLREWAQQKLTEWENDRVG